MKLNGCEIVVQYTEIKPQCEPGQYEVPDQGYQQVLVLSITKYKKGWLILKECV